MRKVFIFGDYKQAESRVVAWRGPVPRLKTFFRSDVDIHTEVAKVIAKVIQENKLPMPNKLFYKKPWNELTSKDKDERQIGKTGGHAGNYGIQKYTFAQFIGIPVKYAEIILAAYHTQFPEVKLGYQKYIHDCLVRDKTIVTALGRPRTFYDVFGDQMLRQAYAYYGQSTVGDLLTRLIRRIGEHFEEIKFTDGVVWTPDRIRSCGFDTRINAHDAVGVSVPDSSDLVSYVVKVIKEEAEFTLNIDGDDLVIPMDFKIGPSWGELHDYEQ